MRKSIPVFTIAFVALMAALPVHSAGSSPLVHASAAQAFGVRVHVATPVGDPSLTVEPTPFASAADPSVDAVTRTVLGPIRAPEDGTLLGDARALVAEAARTLTPRPASSAEAVVTQVSLFETAGIPLIRADVIHAASSTECTSPSSAKTSAAGSRLVGLSIAGEVIDETPEPNTEIPLVYDNGTPADASDDLS
ncbi:MAG TPA: choice-of-anchor P family protein, partial [Actinomycetota bacterium]|nr:choice-of-anchor P family protein [Actinomycetota bacterium]